MQVFVTGATGVLGRRVVPMLAADGHDVTAVARGRAARLREVGATPVAVDLFDRGVVASAIEGHDAVIDLATRIPATSRMMLPWAWRNNDRLRSVAASHVADAAIGTGARYVRESFGLVYAEAGDRWVDEDAPLAPIPNTRSSLDAEAAADRVTAAGGVGVALRFALFYGADSDQTRDELAAARRGMASAVIGDPEGFTPHVHLDDAATAVVAALAAPAGVYNVVEDQPLRRREYLAVLQQVAGRPLRTPPRFVARLGPARAIGRSLRLSNAAFRDATGWGPAWTSPRDGLPVVAAEVDGAGVATDA